MNSGSARDQQRWHTSQSQRLFTSGQMELSGTWGDDSCWTNQRWLMRAFWQRRGHGGTKPDVVVREIKMFNRCFYYKGKKVLRERDKEGSGTLINPQMTQQSDSICFSLSLCPSVYLLILWHHWPKEGWFFSQITRWCKFSMRQQDKSGRSVVQRCNFAGLCLLFSLPNLHLFSTLVNHRYTFAQREGVNQPAPTKGHFVLPEKHLLISIWHNLRIS